jgi:uncharacterized protein involved in exopolysaccharide biosynthesis
MQMLDHTQEELRADEMRKSSLEQQKVYLEAQLAQLKPNSTVFSDTGERILTSSDRLKMARSQLDSARASYGPDHPDIARLERLVAGLEKEVSATDPAAAAGENRADLARQLESAKASLTAAQGQYGPEHPDRMRLERQVASLQAAAAAAPETPVPAKLTPKEADNPAYVQIQASLSSTLNDLASLEQQVAKLQARVNEYQANLALSPKVEQEYRELMRDYDNSKLKYMELRSKQAEAKTAQNLETDRKGERFTLIDPPLPPELPISPNRKLIFIAGLILSGALTFGVLWLMEKIDSSVRGRLDLLSLTGVAPLALVPHIETEAERRSGRRRMQLAVGSAMASVVGAVALTHFFYRPLDVLWFTLARRMGF